MKYFTAKEAKALVKERTVSAYMEDLLDRIKWTASRGQTYYELTCNGYKLSEEDYQFLESLGYKVQREGFEKFKDASGSGYYSLGIVSW